MAVGPSRELGREEDADHSTCVILIEYGEELTVSDVEGEDPEDEESRVAAGLAA